MLCLRILWLTRPCGLLSQYPLEALHEWKQWKQIRSVPVPSSLPRHELLRSRQLCCRCSTIQGDDFSGGTPSNRWVITLIAYHFGSFCYFWHPAKGGFEILQQLLSNRNKFVELLSPLNLNVLVMASLPEHSFQLGILFNASTRSVPTSFVLLVFISVDSSQNQPNL